MNNVTSDIMPNPKLGSDPSGAQELEQTDLLITGSVGTTTPESRVMPTNSTISSMPTGFQRNATLSDISKFDDATESESASQHDSA